MRRAAPGAMVLLLAACACAAGGVQPPARLDSGVESCGWCRMAVSDPRLAAQIAAPLEEPIFFDDIGCLRDFLASREEAVENHGGRALYVADHATGAWVEAGSALYTKVEGIDTPMGSHIIAHATEDSRRADPAATGGISMSLAEVFGGAPRPEREAP